MRPTAVETAVRRAFRSWPHPEGCTLVIGLSGGPDSVALFDAMTRVSPAAGLRLVAAHLDHGLRPDSAADARFCRELCEGRGVSFRLGQADVRGRARQEGGGLEEAARKERYAFLRRVKEEEGALAIAVAHTLDDQAETLLLRLLRGSGRTGLAGMRERSGDLLRPLLHRTRGEVLAHLQSRGLPWREDPSNADPVFLRNRIRGELIPYLESHFNPGLRRVLARTAAVLGDEADALRPLARDLLARAARPDVEGLIVLSTAVLREAPRPLARLALRQALRRAGGLRGVTVTHVQRLLRLVASPAPSGRRLDLPGGRQAWFHFDDLRIGPRREAGGPFAIALPVPGEVALPGGRRLVVREVGAGPGSAGTVSVPEGPLVVRTRRPGDRVLTARREMSLRRFLMDRQVPADLRAGLPVVAVGCRVVWVAGQPTGAPAQRGNRLVTLQLNDAPESA